jgi:hypothetical protein
MFPLLLLVLGMVGIAMASSGAAAHGDELQKTPSGKLPPIPPGGKTPTKPGAKPPSSPLATRNFPSPTAPLPPVGAKVQRRTIPLKGMKPFKTLPGKVNLYQAGIPFNKIANEMPFSRAGRAGYPGAVVFVSLGETTRQITVVPPLVFIKLSPDNQAKIRDGFGNAMRKFDMSQTTAAFNYARALAEIAGNSLAKMNPAGGNDVLIQSFIMPPPRAATPTTKKAPPAVAYWSA